MKTLLILLLLAGCATTQVPDAVLPPAPKTVHLEPKLLEPCEPLDSLYASNSWEDILTITVNNFEKYAACAKKQENSVKLLKKFSNYKEE
jgi:hypothetical protein